MRRAMGQWTRAIAAGRRAIVVLGATGWRGVGARGGTPGQLRNLVVPRIFYFFARMGREGEVSDECSTWNGGAKWSGVGAWAGFCGVLVWLFAVVCRMGLWRVLHSLKRKMESGEDPPKGL